MAKDLEPITIKELVGINNKHSPEEVGFGGLLTGVNIDMSDGKKPRLRPGYNLVIEQPGHSLWCNHETGLALYVKDNGMLCLVDIDTPATQEVVGVGDRRMWYTNAAGYSLCSNGYFIGYFDKDSVLHALSRSGTYDRSDYEIAPYDERDYYDSMPACILLDYYGGRTYGYSVEDDCIYYSNANSPFECNKEENFWRFSGVTLLSAVDNGIYVGNSDGVWFAAGRDPKDVSVAKVCDYPPVLGSGITDDGRKYGNRGVAGRVALWESAQGKVMGAPGGSVTYMTDRRAAYPLGEQAASVVRELNGESHHLTVMRNPSGNAQSFRATDYAEAEVRRSN